MLSRNLLIASVAFVFLATAVSAAPVEDKEPEENDFEAEEGEEELSEEEEDDDDSKGQHMKGAGAQHATMVPKGPGSPSQVSLSHGSSGHVASSHVSSLMTSEQTSGSTFVSSEVQSQTEEAATTDGATHENGDNGESQTAHIGSQIEAPGSESVLEKSETEANGNGHKQLINGEETGHPGMNNFMEGTTQIDTTGGFDSFGSNLEITGIIDHSSHDFLIGLMGGMGDSFAPDPFTDTIGMPSDHTEAPSDVLPTCLIYDAVSADHMGLAFHVESTGAGLDPELSAILSSVPPGFSVTSDNGAQYYSPGEMTDGADTNGAESPSINGNGRLRPVTDIHKAETLDVKDPTISPVTDIPSEAAVTSHAAGVGMHTDVTGFEGEPVTNGHRQIDITIMGDSIYSSRPPGYESTGVTEGISNHTGCPSQTQILFLILELDLQINLVLLNRHNQLFQQVNSTTHLVRVLKLFTMWLLVNKVLAE
ncbi:hypothetical protein QTP70_028657 [Hemibagrus guttatus]|uniref:Uncharacterized protein n=1 Tax=Hemibagrus guttatus TaxID=175788 RepID=A0AAE0UMS0_9TELE|nr:hypothetical protein QTP70_028657 [Hemibagrus guttatus]